MRVTLLANTLTVLLGLFAFNDIVDISQKWGWAASALRLKKHPAPAQGTVLGCTAQPSKPLES